MPAGTRGSHVLRSKMDMVIVDGAKRLVDRITYICQPPPHLREIRLLGTLSPFLIVSSFAGWFV